MTPCFLHTPNMTNKWNDFKSSGSVLECEEEGAEDKPTQFINHQANPSNDCNPLEDTAEGEKPTANKENFSRGHETSNVHIQLAASDIYLQ